jgi:hypothetical protein
MWRKRNRAMRSPMGDVGPKSMELNMMGKGKKKTMFC